MSIASFHDIPDVQQRIVLENELAFAILTNIPITPGHTLLVPKRVVSKFDDLEAEELIAMADLQMSIKEALREAFGATGFNLAWNEGESAGQSVPHLHLHVVPRQEGDIGITEYEPRKFLYRPGSREETPEAELVAVAEEMKKVLSEE
jgi:diadenosine tetraphosphate (Ap4A) HIT family hydrolase